MSARLPDAGQKPWLLYALIALTVSLGIWQACRAYYKQTLLAAYTAQQQGPALRWSDGALPIWQRVQPQGAWLAAQTFLLAPRYRHTVAGSEIITPLRLNSGEIVLVNRGWLADGKTPPPPPTTLPVLQTEPWPRFFELGATPAQGRRLQNLTAARAATLTGLPVAIAYAQQQTGPDDGLLRDWPAPDFMVPRHLGYMLTWWGCSVCGVLLLRRLRKGGPT